MLMFAFGSAFAAQKSGDAAATYKRSCAGCHGPDGSGQTAMGKAFKLKPLSSPDVQNLSDTELHDVIANGKGKMPAYKAKLSNEEIQELVTYIRTLKK